MEKEDYIWRRKIYSLEKNKTEKEKLRNIFGDRTTFFAGEKINSRGKGGKHLEKGNMLF